jgi:hypothetical protein
VPIVTICAALQFFPQLLPSCRADIVALRNGGLIRGRVTETLQPRSRKVAVDVDKKPVVITTVTGGRVVLDASDVQNITRRPLSFEEFELRVRTTPAEVDPLWALAEWCRSKGLKSQRALVLNRILVIDPDHVRAHQGLGQGRFAGQWKTHDEEMRSRGFVKHQGRYVTEPELEMLKKTNSQKRIEHNWNDRVRGWVHGLVSDNPERRRRGLVELLKINSADAIPALSGNLRAAGAEDLRCLYVQILDQIVGPAPVSYLVDQSLFDESSEVRAAAQKAITSKRRNLACPLYLGALHHADNTVVRRAAVMLGRFGDIAIAPDLIEALVTTHSIQVQVLDTSNTYSFGANGSFGNNGAVQLPPDVYGKLVTGQYPNGVIVNNPQGATGKIRTISVNRDFQNPEVRSSLETLTKESFGYDKDQWRHWWAMHTTGVVKSSKTP